MKLNRLPSSYTTLCGTAPLTASSSPNTIEFGAHTREVLLEEGIHPGELEELLASGAVQQAEPRAKL